MAAAQLTEAAAGGDEAGGAVGKRADEAAKPTPVTDKLPLAGAAGQPPAPPLAPRSPPPCTPWHPYSPGAVSAHCDPLAYPHRLVPAECGVRIPSEALGIALALDIGRQLDHWAPRLLLLAMGVGIAHDNWRTLGKMRDGAKSARSNAPPGSGVTSWPL